MPKKRYIVAVHKLVQETTSRDGIVFSYSRIILPDSNSVCVSVRVLLFLEAWSHTNEPRCPTIDRDSDNLIRWEVSLVRVHS